MAALLVILDTPTVPLLTGLFVALEVTVGVDPATGDAVGKAQPHGGAAHNAAHREEPAAQRNGLATAQRKQRIEPGPGGRQACAAGGESRQVQVRGEEQRRREKEQRQRLHWTGVQRRDERREKRGWEGRGCWRGRGVRERPGVSRLNFMINMGAL